MITNSQCPRCVHLEIDDRLKIYSCSAFPDEIPDAIMYGEVEHNEVREDQSGTAVFKAKPGMEVDTEERT